MNSAIKVKIVHIILLAVVTPRAYDFEILFVVTAFEMLESF